MRIEHLAKQGGIRGLKRVLLIFPPTTILSKGERKRVSFPIGISYIAAVLLEEGFHVKLLDATFEDYTREEKVGEESIRYGMSFDKIKDTIANYRPDVVGISVFCSAQAENAHPICRVAKEVSSEILTVMGGAYPTAETEQCLKDPNLDFAVIGEGERAFVNLLRDPGSYPDGIVNSPFIEDLDSLPWPARQLVEFTDYSLVPDPFFIKRKPYAYIFSSRGCPFQCTFCFAGTMHGKTVRARTAENVLDEIEFLIGEYGIKEILFGDDNLTVNRNRAMRLFQGMIDRHFDLAWATPGGLSIATLDKELLIKMKESGCYGLIIAPESGSPRVLSEIMHKPVTVERTEDIVRTLADIDIEVAAFWMLGLPGETKEDMRTTIAFATRLKAINPRLYSSFSIFTPFKGTKLYEVCRQKGYLPSTDTTRMKYCTASIETEEFSHEWVQEMRFNGWLRANHATSEGEVKSVWIPGADASEQ